MPDAHGNFKPFVLSRKAAATYDRIFPKRPPVRIDSGMDAPLAQPEKTQEV
jgi:hypothetical protein